jgi:twitching motility protein PilU
MALRDLLKIMVDQDASDLYLTAGLPPAYRVEGNVVPRGKVALEGRHTAAIAESVMSEKQRAEFARTKEMNLAIQDGELGRFRVNIFQQRGEVGLVIRQIKVKIRTLDELGMPPVLKDIIMTKRGLILVVGATGSGKSTLLAALIDHRNSNASGHIVTIEDPVEFVHPHKRCVVTQREVGLDTETYAAALKNTLRQAPDVILIGEIRDAETMEAAIAFAETGHLCLGTLHANNANQAIERVLNFFPPEGHAVIRANLALNLRAIISQRLIPTVDEKRAAALEILTGTQRAKDLIHRGEIAELKEVMKQGTQEGMQAFDQAMYTLYVEKRVTLETALAYADSPTDLRLRIRSGADAEAWKAQPTTTLKI